MATPINLSRAQKTVLSTLREAGEPLFNGTLGARTGLIWNSRVFVSLKRLGLVDGHPFELTSSGRAAARRIGGEE